MLEDMEALFSLDNTPGNVPDTGSNCFCFPDIRSQVMGLHVLQDDKRISSSKIKEKSLLFDSKKTSELLFEPSSLHKYSSGMREMKLEYFFGENEDEPLVSTNILPFLGPNSSREGVSHIGASASSSSSNNSNYNLGHNNHSTSMGSVVGSSSSNNNSNSNSNSSSYINSNINIISNNSSASNITNNTISSHHGNGANTVIPPNQYGSLQNSDVQHTPKRPVAPSQTQTQSQSPSAKGGTEQSAAYSSGASEDSLGFNT